MSHTPSSASSDGAARSADRPEPIVIDETGVPYVDASESATSGGSTPRRAPGTGSNNPQFGFAGGMPGVRIPANLLGRDGKPSLWKILGWRGVLGIVLAIGVVVAVAMASFVVLLFALPVLLILAGFGWFSRRVSGRRTPQTPARSRTVVVRVRP